MIEQLQLVLQDLDRLEQSANNRTYSLKGKERRLAFKRRNCLRSAKRAILAAVIADSEIKALNDAV